MRRPARRRGCVHPGPSGARASSAFPVLTAAPLSPRPGPRRGRAPGGERDHGPAQAARRDQPDPGLCCAGAGGLVVFQGPRPVLPEPGRIWLGLPVSMGGRRQSGLTGPGCGVRDRRSPPASRRPSLQSFPRPLAPFPGDPSGKLPSKGSPLLKDRGIWTKRLKPREAPSKGFGIRESWV